jgi:receptor protein-tyrosine kinase
MVELHEFWRVVRYRIVAIALLTAIGIGAAALWLARSPAEYVATTRLFISGASAASQYDAQQGGIYAQDRVVSYEQLVNSRALAQRTIEALNLDMDAETLAARVTSKSFPDAAVMDVSAAGDSPEQARDIANGLATQFIALASSLETPPESGGPVVRLSVIDAAQDGTPSQILPDKLVYIFGGLVGFFAGLIIAFVWESYTRRIRDGADVNRVIGERPAADLPASLTDVMPVSQAEANEAIARLRVNIAAADGSVPHTIALAGVSGRRDRLARRFTAEAGLNLANALVADNRTALLLVLDPSPDVKARISRHKRSNGKNSEQHVPIQWGFGDGPQDKALLDRDAIVESLRQLRTTYDFVIVVLPPLSQFARSAAVAPVVDGVVAVGIYHQTRCRDFEEHMAQIHRTGATSLGAAFARRSLISRSARHTAAQPAEVSVAAESEPATRHSFATPTSPLRKRERVETLNSSRSLGLSHP